MGESITLLEQIKGTFDCKPQDVRTYSPLTLAYIGDAVYDLIIRSVVVERGNCSPNQLHRKTTHYVSAVAQSRMMQAMEVLLTEDELSVYRRGRNAKSHTTAKNASVGDYRKATGFEALMGFLYLTNQTERILELVKRGIEAAGMEL